MDVVDLAQALADGRAWGSGVRVRTLTFPSRDELEGYRPLTNGFGLFVTSSREGNLTVGKVKQIDPRKIEPEM